MPLVHEIDDYDLTDFTAVVRSFGSDKFGYVVTPNTDHVIRFYDDPIFRSAYADASYVLLDSRVISRLLRLTRGLRIRVCTGSDLTAKLFRDVIAADDRVVLIGGSADQAARLAGMFGLRGIRHHCPPMGFINDPRAVEECLEFIEANSPFRYCLLGVGAPQQELIAQNLKRRGRARGLAFCIGASINFLTGSEVRAPRWIQAVGAEWAFRLAQNPGRLARRYLVRGPRILKVLREMTVVVRPPVLPAQ
jgi:exopolysaccharide biosynthesis WecB/TagA/CpsF family protein